MYYYLFEYINYVLHQSHDSVLHRRIPTSPQWKNMKQFAQWVTQLPRPRPTTQCQVGWYMISNSVLIISAISSRTLFCSKAYLQQSTACCCILSDISANLTTATSVYCWSVFWSFFESNRSQFAFYGALLIFFFK